MADKVKVFEREMADGKDEAAKGYLPIYHRSSVIYPSNLNTTTSDLQRRTVVLQSSSHVHVLIQRRTSGKVNKVEPGVYIVSSVLV